MLCLTRRVPIGLPTLRKRVRQRRHWPCQISIFRFVCATSSAWGRPRCQTERAVFWANHCKADPEAFDGENRLPESLYARLDRLLLGEPISEFKAKIDGLKQTLAEIDEELVEEDSLASPGDDTPNLAKDGTFIRRVCDQSIAMLPALAAVGAARGQLAKPTDLVTTDWTFADDWDLSHTGSG